MAHVRRALDDLDEIARVGQLNGQGRSGWVRLGVRIPPVGEPWLGLLAAWRGAFSDVVLSLHELNEHEIRAALAERRPDAALVTRHTLWPEAATTPIYRERLVAALPLGHPLCDHDVLTWLLLRQEIILTQQWGGESRCAGVTIMRAARALQAIVSLNALARLENGKVDSRISTLQAIERL